MLESKDHQEISGFGGVLDLTFAFRVRGWMVSECQIHSTGTRICEAGSSVYRLAFPHLPQASAIHEMAWATVRVEESQCGRQKPNEDAVSAPFRAVSAGLRERHEYRKIYRARPGIYPIGADARHARGTSAVLLAPYAQSAAGRCRGTGRWPD